MTTRTFAQVLLSTVALAFLAPSQEAATSAPTTSPLTVLTVYWSSESFPGTQALDAIIQEGLRSRSDRIDYFAEYLESDRFPDDDATLAFRDYIRRKYRGRRIDVVIAVTDVALQFALSYRAELFPDAPIVFVAVAAPDASTRNAGPGVTGILSGPGFGETLLLALKIHPATRRVFYVAGASDPALRESMREQLHAVAGQVELTDITVTSLTRLVAAVKAVPPGSLILYVRYSQDDAGNVRFPSEIAPLVAQASTVPVYGVSESYLGSGVVGGVVTSLRALGTRIAEITNRILDGTRPQQIPVEHVPLVATFDWRQLRRWGISEGSLPPHSIVLFRDVSVWELYRVPIVVTVAILVLQSALIAGLVLEHRRRRRAEMDSRRNLAAMAHMDRRAAMGELATSLAHELNQPLNAILQNAGVAQMLMTSRTVPPELGEMTDIISDIRKDDLRASEVIRRMRGLLQKRELESHPVDLNEVVHETIAIVRPDGRARGIELDTDLADGAGPVLGDRIHLQQVLLNLLINAMDAVAGGPADRRRVRVETKRTNGEVRLAVEDTGRGIPGDRLTEVFEPFYTTKREGSGMGMGLAIARSNVEAHGGRMEAENNAHGGATVWFSVPIS